MPSRLTVAVVGAGASGLAAIKACLEEDLHPVCFEQNHYVGGLWHYTEDVLPYQGAVAYDSLTTNTSKAMSCYSDYPFSNDKPQYISNLQIAQYLEEFTEHFNLRRYIRLQHVVDKVEPSPSYDNTGSWLVSVTNKVTGLSETSEFDRVIVCNGRQRDASMPNIQGRELFQGEQFHALRYRNTKGLEDKNILIIGNANSAGDIATAASEVAKSVVLSVGRGTWITQRLGSDGTSLPLDFTVRRVLTFLPLSVVNWILKRKSNKLIDHLFYGIVTPDNKGPLYTSLLTNDKLAAKIKECAITVKPYVSELFPRHARFSDGSQTNDIDVIIYATGYKLEWNFLSPDILPCNWKDLSLYKLVWPEPHLHPSLALVGCSSVRGPVIPVLELQARWVAAVFSGRCHLPNAGEMRREIAQRKEQTIKQYGYLKVALNSLFYQDEMVAELGLKPPLLSMLYNPRDIIRWYFGPCFPMLNRLYGPHRWEGAREAIDNAMEDALTQQHRAIRQLAEKKKIH